MLDRPANNAGTAPIPPQRSSQVPSGSPGGFARDNLPAFLAAIRQRRRTLIATIILIPLCAWLTLHRITPLYTATGSLIYQPGSYRLQELQSVVRDNPTTESMMASQAELLQSLHIAEVVAERGNLYQNPEFNPALRPPGMLRRSILLVQALLGIDPDPPPEEPIYGPVLDPTRDRTMQAVRARLHAEPVRFSHVIEVSFVSADPLLAAAAVNNAMDTYIKDQYRAKYKLVAQATDLLKTEAAELRNQVHKLEEDMTTYRGAHAMSQGIHAGTATEEISQLTEDLAKAQSESAAATARLDAARGKSGAEAQAAVAPSVLPLRTQSEQLAGQLQGLQVRLGSAHPTVTSLTRQLSDSRRALNAEIVRVVAATEAEQRAAAGRVRALQADLDQAKHAAQNADKAQIPLNGMARDLDAARSQLQAVLERIHQTAQQAQVESAEAHEISLAVAPEYPSSPRTPQAMAASIVAAIFLGLLLVYILHLADNTLRSGEDIRALTGLPCLALIPEVGRRALGHLSVHDYVARRPLTAFAEQVRSLRAGVSLDIDHPQIVTVTAAGPAEGKSLLTLSLARSAQLGGERVLAIECDVRRSSFHHRLGGNAAPGLLDILRGDANWADALQEDPITSMKYITAGHPGGDILGLFLAHEMRQLLSELRDHFDLIVLDSPPIEAMTEARVVAALADATLLCARWRSTQAKTLLHAMDLLRGAHARVIGIVLTRVDPNVHVRSGYADAAVYHRRYASYYRG